MNAYMKTVTAKSKANLKRQLNFWGQRLGEFDTQKMAEHGKRRIVKNK